MGTIEFDACPGQVLRANITQINPAADPQSRQFQVRLTLNNLKQNIKPGMYAHVTFVTDTVPHALMVPRESVLTDKAGQYVMVIDDDNIAHHVAVTVGTQNVTDVQVFGQLHPGQKVVTLSMLPVKDGAKVKISPPASTLGLEPSGVASTTPGSIK